MQVVCVEGQGMLPDWLEILAHDAVVEMKLVIFYFDLYPHVRAWRAARAEARQQRIDEEDTFGMPHIEVVIVLLYHIVVSFPILSGQPS